MIQVLIDADNLASARIEAFLRAVPLDEVQITVAGSPRALAGVPWPSAARIAEAQGWQQADLALIAAHRADEAPLVLVTGDGDFAMLAATHPGPVLVISDRPASRLRTAGTVIDPVIDGLDAVRRWFDAVLDRPWE